MNKDQKSTRPMDEEADDNSYNPTTEENIDEIVTGYVIEVPGHLKAIVTSAHYDVEEKKLGDHTWVCFKHKGNGKVQMVRSEHIAYIRDASRRFFANACRSLEMSFRMEKMRDMMGGDSGSLLSDLFSAFLRDKKNGESDDQKEEAPGKKKEEPAKAEKA